MRFLPVIAAFLCGVLFAQTQESTAPSAELSATPSAAPSAAMLRARAEAEHIRKLVEAGALPRLKLEESEQALARLEDEEILQRTLYGSLTVEDLTEVQTQEMVEAARRQLNYQRQRLDAAKKLADEGVAARTSVTPVLEDFDRSGRTVDLAESRARLFRELAAMARSEAGNGSLAGERIGKSTQGCRTLRWKRQLYAVSVGRNLWARMNMSSRNRCR